VRHFSSDAEVIAAAETWLDRQPSDFFFFLSGLQKLEQRAKKCIELRAVYVEYSQSLVAVACFLFGRAKDLSAPFRNKFIMLLQMHLKRNFSNFGVLNTIHTLVKNTENLYQNRYCKCIHFIWKCKFTLGVSRPVGITYQSSVKRENKGIKF